MRAAVTEVRVLGTPGAKCFDVHHKNGSPIARPSKIGALFDMDRTIAGQGPSDAGVVRGDHTVAPRGAGTHSPGTSDVAGAIRYARSRSAR